jgi:hypothetical protein
VDTDDLSPMAYDVILQAADLLDVLKAQLGASASGVKTEDDFLRGVRTHLRGILRSTGAYLEGGGCLDDVDVREFRAGVRSLISHVDATLATPAAQRKWTSQGATAEGIA